MDPLEDQPYTTADEPDRELSRSARPGGPSRRRQMGMAALSVGALGVVFGDIGTSPLYALTAVFTVGGNAVAPTVGNVYGVISLVFWAITLIVSVEFVGFIMRADNDGEGGIMALVALVQNAPLRDSRFRWMLIALGMFGVALFFGDGMITPAISVLSAVEGLEVVDSGFGSFVVPVTIGLLAGLFAIQRYGTGAVGRLFGPVMCVWFGVLAVAGIGQIASDPAILRALSPSYGLEFLFNHPGIGFLSLGAVVLTITGAEALYADMGHFGRRPISRAWFLVVFPALTLNYMGQGSLIVEHASAISNPFFLLLPGWSRLPVVLLATVATIIASQAVISGAFSVTRQAVRLGFLPRVAIRHTSADEVGQVYAPAVNWTLLIAVVALVVGFGSSAALASAYGVAVTGTITADTVLFLVVAHALWRKPGWLVAIGAVVFLTVDLTFLAANANKIAHGGWFPLLIGAVLFTVLSTWRRGSEALVAARIEREGELSAFVDGLREMTPPLTRVPGTGVYLNLREATTPIALRANVEETRTMYERIVILTMKTARVPHVPPAERLVVDDLGYDDDGISHVTARFGFQDRPDVPATLQLAGEAGLEADIDVDGAFYFLSHVEAVPESNAGMRMWRKRLFVLMARNAASPIGYFDLPPSRTLTIGSTIGF